MARGGRRAESGGQSAEGGVRSVESGVWSLEGRKEVSAETSPAPPNMTIDSPSMQAVWPSLCIGAVPVVFGRSQL